MPYRAFDRHLVLPFSPDLDDWIPQDHSVRFVAAFLDSLTDAEYAAMGIDLVGPAVGAPAYHPLALLAAWIGGFMLGIRSSRKLEVACQEVLPLRWVTGNQTPDHNTLWRFYRQHRLGMRWLLAQTVAVALAAELVPLVVLAIDGTKISGAAARARSYDAAGLAALQGRVEQAIRDLEAQNTTNEDGGPPRLPPGMAQAEALRARVAEALERVAEADAARWINLTDPDAVLLPTRPGGFVAGYNAQAAVTPLVATADGRAGRLITAAEITTERDDHAQLLPLLEASAQATGADPAVVLADGGYHSGAVLADCAARGQVVVMPETQGHARVTAPYHQDQFPYDPVHDQVHCPHGQVLDFRFVRTRGAGEQRVYRGDPAVCRDCPAFGVCTTNARQGREIGLQPAHGVLLAHRRWMGTAAAQALKRQRPGLIEGVFGVLKEQLGLRRFLVRGRAAVGAEWSLVATANNLRTLVRYWRAGQVVLEAVR